MHDACPTLLRMGNSDSAGGDYGPRLAAYIDDARGDLSVRAFAELHDLDHVQISRWKTGTRPGLDQVRKVADALGVTLGRLLIIMGVGEPADFTVVDGPEPEAVTVARAIDEDPGLSEQEREMLRELLTMFERLRNGATAVTSRSKPPRRRRTRQ